MQTVDNLREFFTADRFVEHNGIEIVDSDGERSLVKAAIGSNHLNAGDAVQGGMLFTIADFAFAVLANQLHPITVTSSSSVTFLAPCMNTEFITAESREISRYRHNCVHEVIVRDDKGRAVCIAQVNGFIKEQISK